MTARSSPDILGNTEDLNCRNFDNLVGMPEHKLPAVEYIEDYSPVDMLAYTAVVMVVAERLLQVVIVANMIVRSSVDKLVNTECSNCMNSGSLVDTQQYRWSTDSYTVDCMLADRFLGIVAVAVGLELVVEQLQLAVELVVHKTVHS